MCDTHYERGETMNAQFKKGVIELCVLGVLAERDMYGYEVVKELSADLDTNENTIYPILRRLTKDGLLQSYTVNTGSGPIRKYFTLTDEGKNTYHHLLDEWDIFIQSVNHVLKRRKKDE